MIRIFQFFLLILIPANLMAQGKLTGVVRDKTTQLPVVGAHISVGNMIKAANSDGEFVFENIESGSCIVKISSIGYLSREIAIIIENAETTFLEIFLETSSRILDEVVVSATRTENRVSNIPGRVEVITPEKLNLTGSISIDEIISLLPGIQTARSFGMFSHKATVSMRGVSGKEQARTLVLLDGIPVNKSDGGSVNWNLISVGETERVEVVKGPGSALYGGNAMGGVINVISKKPKEKLEGNIFANYGTYNTHGFSGNIGGKAENGFYWATSGLYRASDGYITQSYADQKANPFIVNSTFNEKLLNLKAGYSKSKRFSADVNFTIFDDRRETGEKVYQETGNSTDHDTYSFRLTFSGNSGLWSWNSSLYYIEEHYKRVSEWFKDDYTWYDVLSVRSDYGILSGLNYEWQNHKVSTGLDVRHGGVDASDIYYTSTDQVDNRGKVIFYGLYLQDYFTLFDKKFTIVAGIRYDYSTFYDGAFIIHHPSSETNFMKQYQFSDIGNKSWGAFSPRLSFQFKPDEKQRVYLSYSQGFSPSVLDDLCRSGRVRGGFKVANPHLKPEYLHNIEIGGDYKPVAWAKINASIYYSHGTDFLYYVSTGDSIDMGFGNRPIMIRSNISNVDIAGIESDFTLSPLNYFSLYGGYAFNISKITGYDPENVDANVDLTGKYLTDVPKHSFYIGALLRTDFLNAGITSRYKGKMYINDQNIYDDIVLSDQYSSTFTVDIKLQRELYRRINISLIVQNLFNQQIYESKGAVGPGRFIIFECGVKF